MKVVVKQKFKTLFHPPESIMELPIPKLIFQNRTYKCLVHNMEKTKDTISSSANVAIGDEALVKIKTEIRQDPEKIEDEEVFEREGKHL